MDIKNFAIQHRLKTKLDDCGDIIIQGSAGQIYEHSDSALAVLFGIPSKTDTCGRWCPKIWNRLRDLGIAAGLILLQDGDTEGTLAFDPENPKQVKLACSITKVRAKQVRSPERIAMATAALAMARQCRLNPVENGTSCV